MDPKTALLIAMACCSSTAASYGCYSFSAANAGEGSSGAGNPDPNRGVGGKSVSIPSSVGGNQEPSSGDTEDRPASGSSTLESAGSKGIQTPAVEQGTNSQAQLQDSAPEEPDVTNSESDAPSTTPEGGPTGSDGQRSSDAPSLPQADAGKGSQDTQDFSSGQETASPQQPQSSDSPTSGEEQNSVSGAGQLEQATQGISTPEGSSQTLDGNPTSSTEEGSSSGSTQEQSQGESGQGTTTPPSES